MTTMTPPTRLGRNRAARAIDFQARGACRTEDPELFYPVGGSKEVREQEQAAKQVCARCPVREMCLQWALDTWQDDGVLGGLTEQERRAVHGRRPRSSFQRKAAMTIVQHRLGEFQELVGRGLEPLEVAKRMGTNVQTVNNVLDHLAAQATAKEVKAA